jgi:O-antigen/teichoic acid export membrane protein
MTAIIPTFAREAVSRLVRSPLLSGVGANAYAQSVTLVVQLGSTPALLIAWGAKTYGLWLVVSAFPSYIALADLGFSSAAANAITLSVARRAHDEARATFQSTLALNLLTAAAILALALGAIALVPDSLVPGIPPTTRGEVREVCALQAVQMAATLCCGAMLSGFISTGRYALGVLLASTSRLVEAAALVLGALAFHSLVVSAALMLVARLCALVVTAAIAVHGAPWCRLGFRYARMARVRRLAGPALAVTALPIAFAVNLQGLILVIGATVSLEAVATFAAIRTLTRAILQAAVLVNTAIMPEVTRAFGASDWARIRRLTRINISSVLVLDAAAFAVIASFGSIIIAVWTRGRVAPNPTLTLGLAAVACVHCVWLAESNLVLAVNRHAEYTYWFLVVSVCAVFGAIPATRGLGLTGVLLPMLAAEAAMIAVVARVFRRTFGEAFTGLSEARAIWARIQSRAIGAKNERPVFHDGERAPGSGLAAEAPAVAAQRLPSRRADGLD